MDNKTLNEKILEMKQWEQEIKTLTAIVDSIKDEIKTAMDAEHVDELSTGMFTVRYKDVVSSKFDTKTFKKDNANLYNLYLKESVTKRFTIN